jgi:Flp pilus assembly pilin Flp
MQHYLHMGSLLMRFLRDEQGQDLIEYSLLIAFIAMGSAAIFVTAGTSVNSVWKVGSNTLSNAAASAS